MTVQQEERQAVKRLRSLAKARAVRKRNTARARCADHRARIAYRRWLIAERDAFTAHTQDPENRALLRTWLKLWRQEPTRVGNVA